MGLFGTSSEASAAAPSPDAGGAAPNHGVVPSGPDDVLRRHETRSRGPRGPYKKTRDRQAAGSTGPAAAGSGAPAAPAAAATAPLFNEANTKRLVEMPFKLAAYRTGDPNLILSEKEAVELAIPGAVVLNEWCTISPKYVSLVLFSLACAGLVSEKIVLHGAWKQAMDEQRKIDAAKNVSPAAAGAEEAAPKPAAPAAPPAKP